MSGIDVFLILMLLQMYSVSAKIVKPPGEKPDEFEATISQVTAEK